MALHNNLTHTKNFNFIISKWRHNGMEICEEQRLESLEEKKAAHFMQTWCQKDLQLHERRPARRIHVI